MNTPVQFTHNDIDFVLNAQDSSPEENVTRYILTSKDSILPVLETDGNIITGVGESFISHTLDVPRGDPINYIVVDNMKDGKPGDKIPLNGSHESLEEELVSISKKLITKDFTQVFDNVSKKMDEYKKIHDMLLKVMQYAFLKM